MLIGIVGGVTLRLVVYFKAKNAKKFRQGGRVRFRKVECIILSENDTYMDAQEVMHMTDYSKITALYSRLSVGDEDRDGGESNSIQNQKIFLENYARGQHLTNIRHYIDDDESGRFFDRSAYSRMMDDVENGKIGVCIMKDLTRWGRDYLQVGNAMEIFRRNNVRFIAVNNGIDSEKPDTLEFAPFINIMSEWYAKDISKKVKTGIKTKGMSGKPIVTEAPYGYVKDPDNKDFWVIDEEAAEVVRLIFRLFIGGKNRNQIAVYLTQEQIPTPTFYMKDRGRGTCKNKTLNEDNRCKWNKATLTNIRELRELMEYDDMELDTIGDRKTALFLIMSDTDSTFNFVIAMLQSQLFNLLCDKADDEYGGRLPVHVRCLLDEFANIGQIPQFDKLIATIRSREISASIILQSQSQLKAIYKDNADTIVGNCDTTLFLGGKEKTTLKEMSEILGKETIDSFNTSETRSNQKSYGLNYQKLGKELMTQDEIAVMDGGKCILQLRGVRPFFSDKYDITKHPRYKYLSDANPNNAYDIEKEMKRRPAIVKQDEVFDYYEVGADELQEEAE